MLRAAGLALLPAIAACATAPPAPDPAVDAIGRWTIVAVDGRPTGGGRTFRFGIGQGEARAQFGCNDGGGGARIERGWLIPTTDWIITAASCHPSISPWFERRGFEITARPMAIERRGATGLRLRNQRGTIDLARAD